MDVKSLRKSAIMAAVTILVLLIVLSTATYAWFTFRPYVYIEEMKGSVSGSGVELLISNKEEGPFDVTTQLILKNKTEELVPVTTNNLKEFFVASSQDANGIAQSYRQLPDADVDKYLLHGTVYLLAGDQACDVYFDPELLNFGEDIQALASMRVGFIFGGEAGGTYMFKLDELKDTSKAEKRATIVGDGKVYSKTGLVTEAALEFKPYSGSSTDTGSAAGEKPLAHINGKEVISVEYFLWLEGCDSNCFNAVQGKDLALQFGFIGV